MYLVGNNRKQVLKIKDLINLPQHARDFRIRDTNGLLFTFSTCVDNWISYAGRSSLAACIEGFMARISSLTPGSASTSGRFYSPLSTRLSLSLSFSLDSRVLPLSLSLSLLVAHVLRRTLHPGVPDVPNVPSVTFSLRSDSTPRFMGNSWIS